MKYVVLIFTLFVGGGAYYYINYYPPVVKERAANAALQAFAQAVNTKDRAKVSESLRNYLSDDAKAHLDFGFFSLTQDPKMTPQDFDKESFITFIDNVLYTMTDYGYEASIRQFNLSQDGASADVTWRAMSWADGPSYYAGVGVNMRFSTNPECSGKVTFNGNAVQLSQFTCKALLQAVPKPGEEQKLQENPGALGQYLR